MKKVNFKDLFDYETITIQSSGRGHKVNRDAETAIKMLLESNEIAFHLKGKNYKSLEGVCSTIRTADTSKKTTPIIIDGETYLVKSEYFLDFRNIYGNNRHTEKCRVSKVISKPIVKTTEVKPITKPIPKVEITHTNKEIVNQLRNIWKLAKDFNSASLSNLGGVYKPVFEEIINSFSSKLELNNFMEYAELTINDDDLFYIVSFLVNNKLKTI